MAETTIEEQLAEVTAERDDLRSRLAIIGAVVAQALTPAEHGALLAQLGIEPVTADRAA